MEKEKKREENDNKEKNKREDDMEKQREAKLAKLQNELQQKQHERIELARKQNMKVKHLMKIQPLFVKMEDKFVKEVELPLLEQKKKKLQEIRSFFKKPLDQKDINSHMKRYESEAEIKQTEREKKKMAIIREFNSRDNDIKTARVVEQEERLKEEEEEKLKERLKIQEKMNNYFSYVKEHVLEEEFSKVKTAKNSQKTRQKIPNLAASQSEKTLPTY